MHTVAPARASAMAMARPIPREAPVTSAARPVNAICMPALAPHHERRALAEEPEREHQNGAKHRTHRGAGAPPAEARFWIMVRHGGRHGRVAERRRARQELDWARGGAEVGVSRLQLEPWRRRRHRAERARERRILGAIMSRDAV